jgi:hypothetical protein
MDKGRGGSGGGQRCGQLAANMSTLAHPHDDHPPLNGQHHPDHQHKRHAHALFQAEHGLRLGIESFPRQAQNLVVVERHVLRRGVGHAGILSADPSLASMSP